MDERATGLILRVRPLTETSLIVHWLTAQSGRLATVAKGARRPKSPFRGKLDLFFLCDFSFARSRRSELHTLREVVLREIHAGLRQDLAWLQQAAYCARLLEQATESEAPLDNLFSVFTGLLAHLPMHPPTPLTVFAFEQKLLADLGQNPDVAEARLTPGARQILEKCLSADWPELFRIRLAPAQALEIRRFLHGFLTFHLGRVPDGRP